MKGSEEINRKKSTKGGKLSSIVQVIIKIWRDSKPIAFYAADLDLLETKPPQNAIWLKIWNQVNSSTTIKQENFFSEIWRLRILRFYIWTVLESRNRSAKSRTPKVQAFLEGSHSRYTFFTGAGKPLLEGAGAESRWKKRLASQHCIWISKLYKFLERIEASKNSFHL